MYYSRSNIIDMHYIIYHKEGENITFHSMYLYQADICSMIRF